MNGPSLQITPEMVQTFVGMAMDKRDDDKKKENSVFNKKDLKVERNGTKIILPDDPRAMTYDEAIDALNRIKQQESVEVGVHESVDAFPLEGAWALNEVLKKDFGYVMTPEAQKNFFGDKKPSAIAVTLEVAHGKKEQVLWGQFKVPGVEGQLESRAELVDGQPCFVIAGMIKKKDQHVIKKIADDTRKFVKEYSLYKGKAIKVQTKQNEDTEKYELDFHNPPKFLDLSRVDEEQLTFSSDVQSLIQTNLFTPIEKTEECRKHGVPLKRGVLLEGKYGTGKTLTAFVTAKKAEQHGWSFIYLDRVAAIKDVMTFARRYQPAVIFAEDIERIVSSERSTEVDDVLNTIDGIDSKNQEFICIFTTNHIEKLQKAMLRAGRLDAVIHVAPPDAKAAEKLIRIYSNGLIDKKENLAKASKELEGQIPAFIREVVERSKLFAIGNKKAGEDLTISGEDVRLSAVGMKRHFDLVNESKKAPLTPGQLFETAMHKLMDENTDEEYVAPPDVIEMNHANGQYTNGHAN